MRPLISTGDPKKSVDISRKAELYETSSGMITITGGKLTTWRRMAKMAVDRLVEREARDAPCRTHEIPLGQAGRRRRRCRASRACRTTPTARWPPATATPPTTSLRVAAERGELAQPIVDGLPDLLAEAAFAARREQARASATSLLRRTRLGLLAARELRRGGRARARRRGDGAELGWDDARDRRRGRGVRGRGARRGIVVVPSRDPSGAGPKLRRRPRVASAP